MKLDTRAFTSKVARRAFALFVGCALLHVSALAVISFRQVTTELHGQSERRLRQESKAVGLALHKRVLALAAALAPTASLPPARGHETVLLVDDEHEVRMLLQQVLEDQGYVVMSAGRPSDALRIAEHHLGPIHLLLTDMVMPEMSGAVLAERLSATRTEMMVLQMSGYTDYGIGAAESSTAPPAFLQKPFTPDTVARAVRAVLDSAGARR